MIWQITKYVWDALRDLLPFVRFKKHEKHPWRSVTFSNTLPWVFSGFLNCTNGTKMCKVLHIIYGRQGLPSNKRLFETFLCWVILRVRNFPKTFLLCKNFNTSTADHFPSDGKRKRKKTVAPTILQIFLLIIRIISDCEVKNLSGN